MTTPITVFGAGSWGTTLALILHHNGHDVCLWDYSEEQAQRLQKERANTKFLPGISLPDNLNITANVEAALHHASTRVLAVPSHVLRSFLTAIAPSCQQPAHWISVIKGIEQKTLMRMSEVIRDVIGREQQVTTLSGPTHAEEVAHRKPSAIVAANHTEALALQVQQLFNSETFRVYTSTDIVGVELGGSLKNVIALAAGISDGLGLGDNSKAAVMTRGLAEISKLGVALGAQEATFAGLSGMGDLITTCISQHSRNRHVGERLGQGELLQNIIDDMHMVAEGVKTTQSAYDLAKKMAITTPIINEMQAVLFNNKPAAQAVKDLLNRPHTAEF